MLAQVGRTGLADSSTRPARWFRRRASRDEWGGLVVLARCFDPCTIDTALPLPALRYFRPYQSIPKLTLAAGFLRVPAGCCPILPSPAGLLPVATTTRSFTTKDTK